MLSPPLKQSATASLAIRRAYDAVRHLRPIAANDTPETHVLERMRQPDQQLYFVGKCAELLHEILLGIQANITEKPDLYGINAEHYLRMAIGDLNRTAAELSNLTDAP